MGDGSNYSIIALDTFIQSTRDSGYKGTASALAELVDNSIQAKARRIDIRIESIKDSEFPFTVLISDDGHGMDRSTLRQALRFGGSTRFNDREGLGRYGMGLPNASLSQARRVTVYSWTAPDEVYSSHLDVDEIAAGTIKEVPNPKRTQLPLEQHQKHGTVVEWSRCDRLDNRRLSTMVSKLSVSLGRRFRHFIYKGLQIYVNGQEVKPVDPLFLNPKALYADAKQYGEELVYEIEVPNSRRRGRITVTFSELPVEAWHAMPNPEKRQRGISMGAGVSIVRGGREVDFGWFFLGNKRRENYDDWWRCEIQFDPVLDDLMGITHTKQQIRPAPMLLEILSPDMEAISRVLNTRARRAHLKAKSLEQRREAEAIATSRDAILPPVTKQGRKGSGRPGAGEPSGAASYRIVEETTRSTVFFEGHQNNGQVVLQLNPHHPFHKALYKMVRDSDNAEMKSVGTLLDLVLLAAARAEVSDSPAADAKAVQAFKKRWSEALAVFLKK